MKDFMSLSLFLWGQQGVAGSNALCSRTPLPVNWDLQIKLETSRFLVSIHWELCKFHKFHLYRVSEIRQEGKFKAFILQYQSPRVYLILAFWLWTMNTDVVSVYHKSWRWDSLNQAEKAGTFHFALRRYRMDWEIVDKKNNEEESKKIQKHK